jgi:hypothetical protein
MVVSGVAKIGCMEAMTRAAFSKASSVTRSMAVSLSRPPGSPSGSRVISPPGGFGVSAAMRSVRALVMAAT